VLETAIRPLRSSMNEEWTEEDMRQALFGNAEYPRQ
jgi:hypothetical protein